MGEAPVRLGRLRLGGEGLEGDFEEVEEDGDDDDEELDLVGDRVAFLVVVSLPFLLRNSVILREPFAAAAAAAAPLACRCRVPEAGFSSFFLPLPFVDLSLKSKDKSSIKYLNS